MKNKINTPLSDYKRFRRFSQPKQNITLPPKVKENINQISEIYNSLYEDIFPSILCLSKTSFFEKLNKQARDIISLDNSQELQTSSNLQLVAKIKENITKKYDNDYKLLSTEYINYLKNNRNYNYVTNFRKHCAQTDNYALHNCSSKRQGKFIEVKTKNNNKEETSYVICVECKQCYLSNFIFMVCVACNKKFFSNILKENENKNILPATWEKYHCGPIINEIMKCIKCHNILYLNLTSKQLVCLNKNCNFNSKPESILWKCFICSSEFRSKAKIYNPLEFQILKKSINFALLLKKKAAPRQLPCRCEKDISKLTFFHKEECEGELYQGILVDKEIIVCSKCHAINFEEKFTWTCPICSIKFHLHSMIGCKPFSKKKYVINRHFNQSVKNFSKKNNNKEKKEKNVNNINLCDKKDIDLEKSINNINLKHQKNPFSNDISQSIKKGNTFFKKEDNESNFNIRESNNKSLITLKKTNKCSNTVEKRKKHYSTLLEILQERMRSESKEDDKKKNKDEKSDIDSSVQVKTSYRKNNSTNIRNKNNLHYKNKTCENNPNLYKKEDLEKYSKDNLKENNISNSKNNYKDLYNKKNDQNNKTFKTEEKVTQKIKVNKKFHSKITPFNADESINENNGKHKDIIRIAESTDFSSLKTLSSNEHKTKNNLFFSLKNSNKASNLFNSFRNRNKKTNTNNSKEYDGYSSYKLTNNQLTENSYQDIINDLKFSLKLSNDTNSSFRLSYFGNISSSNEICDTSKKINNNINEKSEEIPEIIGKDNKLIFNFIENKNEIDNSVSIIEFNNEKEDKNEIEDKKELDKKNKISGNKHNRENKDEKGNESIKKDKKEISKKSEESLESEIIDENEIKKSDNNENLDEIIDKFYEKPFPSLNKKNARESFNINNDFMFQNVLISQEKLNTLASKTNIPSFQETDYNFIRPIGEGTFGVVYLVENNETYEQFALKKIVCRDYNELIKHKNELELIYSVNHENILKLLGIQFKYLDETTSAIYVLMELAQNDWNTEIKRRMLAKKNYKENEIVEILKQTIKGFLFLQENDIAHRDIKPQNILLFPNNIYKIADFGEAKNIKSIDQLSTLKGSELYMSPVLYKGYKFNIKSLMHNPYKSDVFSLGYCLLYALCLNLKVLETVRELTTMRSIIANINKYIMKNKYSDKLMNIIYKMIDPNEDERYDFEDLSIELNENF